MTTTTASPLPPLRRPLWAALLTAAGTAWLLKIASIAITDGDTTDSGIVAAFFVAGALALAAGGAAAAWALARRAHVALRVVAAAVGAVAALMAFDTIDYLLPEIGSSWFKEEVGILGTALVALAAGLAGLTRSARRG